jgi:hypothetical protein
MSEKLQKVIVNCETGVTEYIDLTDEEIAEVRAREAQSEIEMQAKEAELAAKAAAKASAEAKLAALGLTPEEIAALR